MTQKKRVPVVAAIFHRFRALDVEAKKRGPEILLFQRKREGVGGGFFEFPGGKVEEGETEQQALVREIQEELAIEVLIQEKLGEVDFVGSSGRDLRLAAFFVQGPHEDAQLLDHDSKKWIFRDQILMDELALGDRPLITKAFDFLDHQYQFIR